MTMTETTQDKNAEIVLSPLQVVARGLEQMRPQFKVALPSHISAEKFERVIITALNNKPDLALCDRRSLFNACTKAAQDGLLPDGREGSLVPFKDDDGKKIVTWVPMVFGLIKLMRQSNEIDTVGARIVFQKEIEPPRDGDGEIITDEHGRALPARFEFIISEGQEKLRHEPILWGERGEKVLVYAYARFKSGHVEYAPMHKTDVLKRKNASRAQNGPWKSWEDEMWLKTAIKGLSKRMPLSPNLLRALDRDEEPNEFEKMKTAAIQSITDATSMIGSHDIETGEIHDAATDEEHGEDETATELTAKITIVATLNDPDALAQMDGGVRDWLREEDREDLLGLWNSAVLERKRAMAGRKGK